MSEAKIMEASAMPRPGLLFCTVVAIFSYTPEAFAYLDPGTGSILLQGLIAGLAGGLMFIRMYWKKLKAMIAGRSRDETGLGGDAQDKE